MLFIIYCRLSLANVNKVNIFLRTVPPNIIDEGTSGDIVATEGENVSLSCKADGRPLPRILWRREDGTNIQLRNEAGELHKGKRNTFTNILTQIRDRDVLQNIKDFISSTDKVNIYANLNEIN